MSPFDEARFRRWHKSVLIWYRESLAWYRHALAWSRTNNPPHSQDEAPPPVATPRSSGSADPVTTIHDHALSNEEIALQCALAEDNPLPLPGKEITQ